MANHIIIIAIIAIAIFLIWVSSAQSIEPFTVISAHDGDTITVKDRQGNKFNIRFAVVDANEDSNHLRQSGGEQATNYLRSILPIGSKVSLQFTGNTSHNRTVATVYKGSININLAMVKAGHAVVDPRYLKQVPKELQNSYTYHESVARRQRLGRWSKKEWCAEYPWEFRRRMSQRKK